MSRYEDRGVKKPPAGPPANTSFQPMYRRLWAYLSRQGQRYAPAATLIFFSAVIFAVVFGLTAWWRLSNPFAAQDELDQLAEQGSAAPWDEASTPGLDPNLPQGAETTPEAQRAPTPSDPGGSQPAADEQDVPPPHVSDEEAEDAATAAPPPPSDDFVWPLTGKISQPFGWVYSDTMDDWRHHGGLDLQAEAGTTVKAAAAGTVTAVRYEPDWGWTVEIEHAPGYTSFYAGTRQVEVEQGVAVARGQPLAQVDEQILLEQAQGPHLHFELRWAGRPVDPTAFIVGDPESR